MKKSILLSVGLVICALSLFAVPKQISSDHAVFRTESAVINDMSSNVEQIAVDVIVLPSNEYAIVISQPKEISIEKTFILPVDYPYSTDMLLNTNIKTYRLSEANLKTHYKHWERKLTAYVRDIRSTIRMLRCDSSC